MAALGAHIQSRTLTSLSLSPSSCPEHRFAQVCSGRKQTTAPFLCLFDADFVPEPDFLRRVMPYFYRSDGTVLEDLALVQAQWSNLNACDSLLTVSQSLWVDDHHVCQMAWRSAAWGFVNFTGTAGVWRADAIERAGGWKAVTLVEDCELSFRVLFKGFRTVFAAVPVPAELPASVTAYKAQQRRWTLGWAQLLRIHLGTLLYRFRSPSPLKRLHLVYFMCLSAQWPLWCIWQLSTPWLVAHHGLCHKEGGRCAVFFVPLLVNMVCASCIVAVELADRYEAPLQPLGLPAPLRSVVLALRVLPTTVLSAAMLPFQTCAWVEGLLTQHAEFETTPKNGSQGHSTQATCTPIDDASSGVTNGKPVQFARIRNGYVLAELAWVVYHFCFGVYFLLEGRRPAVVLGSLFPAAAVAGLMAFYGDDRPPVASQWPKAWVQSQDLREPLLQAETGSLAETGSPSLSQASAETGSRVTVRNDSLPK